MQSGWKAPETKAGLLGKEISADDGPLGTGASYKTLSVKGEKAILEHHPVTGYSPFCKGKAKGDPHAGIDNSH